MLANQPLKTEFASLAEQIDADFALLEGCEKDPVWPSGEVSFANAQRELAQVITVEQSKA
jgi:hypothetical protein